MLASNVGNVAVAAAVGAIGALIAALTALAQSWFAGRDARLRATAQLDLAARRTNFVRDWLDAHEKIGDANGRLAEIYSTAENELKDAYKEAQLGSTALSEAVKDSGSESFMKKLRALFFLQSGLRRISKFVVAVFYLIVFFGLVTSWRAYMPGVPGEDDLSDEPMAWFVWLMGNFILMVPLRIGFGLWVMWLERERRRSKRASRPESMRADDCGPPPPPVLTNFVRDWLDAPGQDA